MPHHWLEAFLLMGFKMFGESHCCPRGRMGEGSCDQGLLAGSSLGHLAGYSEDLMLA